ncbi:MAG: hypothetical protein WD844_09475 [Thermoleophilaceae bacterium]
MLGAAALIYTGAWHAVSLFLYQHPMLTWLPVLAGIVAGRIAGGLRQLLRPKEADKVAAPLDTRPEPEEARGLTFALPPAHRGTGLLAGLAVLVYGAVVTLFFPPDGILDDFSAEQLAQLPATSQPRLLPRTGVRDDPQFAGAKEIHLVRDPASGGLLWTGEWQAGRLSGPSRGVAVKRLDEVVKSSEIVRAGFDRAVSGLGPGTIKWKAKLKHPFSRIQYPVIVPTGERDAVAVLPYSGYRGFPFRRPYLKGVLVYHQDGRTEDLTPEQAARRPELLRSARIVPEGVARKQAEALARSEEIDGEIVDGEGNRQPFLTALDRDRAVWLTIINERGREGGVKALVFTDSTTGETKVWQATGDERLVSTQDVLDDARSLPLRWEERRCCDSDGHSYDVTLREVVEPRLVFTDGDPYYMVSVVPTDELALGREIEHTLLMDARTGERVEHFRHVTGGPSEDARLQAFFAQEPDDQG